MGTHLPQLVPVILTCVVHVIWSVVQNSAAGVSELGKTSTDSHVWYSNINETFRSQRKTESPDTCTDHRVDTSLSGNGQAVYMTSTPKPYIITDDNSVYNVLGSNSGVYSWDKTKFSSRDFQESYCPYRCKNGAIQNLRKRRTYCAEAICFPCECQKPECQIYGICCPDISVPYLSPPNRNMDGASQTDQVSHLSDKEAGVFHEDIVNKAERNPANNSPALEANDEHGRIIPENVDSKTAEDSGFVDSKDIKAQPRLGCHTPENFLYIRSCLPGVEVSIEVLQKCESDIPKDEIGFDSVAMVTDRTTNAVYYNKYCADCNGVKQHQMWDVELACKTFMRVYSARSQDEFLQQALDTTPYCLIQQKFPGYRSPLSCNDVLFTRNSSLPVIDTCNVTGLWLEYDDDVVAGCSSLTDQAYALTLTSSRNRYKNIFCAICNKDHPKVSKCQGGQNNSNPVPPIIVPPYSILFSLRRKWPTTDENKVVGTCNTTEWPSPDGVCIPVRCSRGKILIDGNCSTVVTQITGLGYRLQLWFLPELDNTTEIRYTIDKPLSEYVLDTFFYRLSGILSASCEYAELSFGALLNISTTEGFRETNSETPKSAAPGDISVITAAFNTSVTTTSTVSRKVQDDHFGAPYFYWATGLVIANSYILRDKFEQTILDDLFSKDVHINFVDRISVNFRPVLMWTDFDITVYCGDIEKHNVDIKCFHRQQHVGNILKHQQFSNVLDMFLNLTQTLTCKFVSFPRSQYLIETAYRGVLPIVTVKLNFNTIQLTIANDSDLSKMSVDASGELNICCDLLDEQITLMPRFRKKTGLIQEIQSVLTLVCMGVSKLCLLMTIVTYARFAVLRTVAGRNNFCLCLSLLLAQASLLASSLTNVNCALCVPLGMLTHFLWLSVYSWNFLCCFYMYKVFGAKIRNLQTNTRSQNLTLMKYVAFSLLTPAIIVSAVVVGAYITSGGRSLGYGGNVCFLNDTILVATTIIGPVILFTITNIIFFLVTIYNIHRVGRLQTFQTSKKDDQRNLYVYVRLSSLTGAFWVIYIIAEVSDVDGLRIAAIILNGLQGFSIFISYTCNNRVLMLYLTSLRPQTSLNTNTNSMPSVTKGRQRNDKHELQHTPSLSSVGSQSAGASVCLTDHTLVKHDSSLDQVAEGTLPQK